MTFLDGVLAGVSATVFILIMFKGLTPDQEPEEETTEQETTSATEDYSLNRNMQTWVVIARLEEMLQTAERIKALEDSLAECDLAQYNRNRAVHLDLSRFGNEEAVELLLDGSSYSSQLVAAAAQQELDRSYTSLLRQVIALFRFVVTKRTTKTVTEREVERRGDRG